MSENQETQAGEAAAEETGALSEVLSKKNADIPHEILDSEKMEHSCIRFRVKVLPEGFQAKVDDVLADLKKDATLPGFRRGKAPLNLIRSRFLKHAREDAIRSMIPRLAEMVGEEKGLEVLAQPGYEGWEEQEDGGPIVKIFLEVRPEIPVSDDVLKEIVVEVAESPVTDEAVAERLEGMRRQAAVYEAAADAAFEEDDALTLDVDVEDDQGRRVHSRCQKEHYTQRVRFEYPQAVFDRLLGAKAGDEIALEGVDVAEEGEPAFPVNYSVKVHEVKKRVLPALDDEFAKDLSEEFESLEQLRERIRTEMTRQEDSRKRNETIQAIYKVLDERVTFDIPQTLVQRMANDSISRTEERFRQYGMSLRSMGRDMTNNIVDRAMSEARTNVKSMLLADQIGRHWDVQATDEQVEQEIARIAEELGRKPLAVRASLEREKRMDGFKADLRIRQVNDRLIEHASVRYVEAPAAEAAEESSAAE